jgi:UDP-N-acetylmuramyl pentapeptide phosphotransferase/UDP-N-acetylglucosamine-1-phosphate transferase
VNGDFWFTVGVAMLIAGYLARGLLALRLKAPPEALMKVNVSGRRVPAVMGGPLVLASLMTLALVAIAGVLGWEDARPTRLMTAVAFVTAVMAIAGSWDDRRGDERPRGFRGHLGAARSGALTGGLVKIAAGVLAGVGAAAIFTVGHPGFPVGFTLRALAMSALQLVPLIGLTANFVNLTDRAPGRAAKVTLVVAVPLVIFGNPLWAIAAAPLVGALLGCFGPDLKERAMLGDAGANPLGAVVGLGLAVEFGFYGSLYAIVLLLALNLASEKWSFSRFIDRVAPLRWLDSLGRRQPEPVRERTAGE